MSKKKSSFKDTFYNSWMPKIYGIGAAVVIVGAMFKIMHWAGANEMLVLGLSTEALIFFFSAFQPMPHEPEWHKVYPQLGDDWQDPHTAEDHPNDELPAKSLNEMMSDADINQDMIDRLGTGLQRLSESTEHLRDLSDAAGATTEYTDNVRAASDSLVQMNRSYGETVEAMSSMADATIDSQEYHSQIQNITKNLGALNAVYEMELQDANSHLKAMNKFYGNLSAAMENMTSVSEDTEQFKNEMSDLTTNLNHLNTVYGNMLAAMKA